MTHSEIDWYIRGFILSSLLLQVLLYFLPPLRRITYSRWVLCLVSIVFSMSTWIPTFTLVLICGRAIYGYKDSSEYKPPLLKWAALLLLHIAGHGQERDTPYSPNKGDLGKEFFRVLLEFVIYHVLLFGIIFLFEPAREIPNLAVPLLMLACMRTFLKLKHLRDQIKEMDERLITPAKEDFFVTLFHTRWGDEKVAHDLFRLSQKLFWLDDLSVLQRNAYRKLFRRLDSNRAIRIIEVELNLIYAKFYGGVVPSIFELVLVSLLPAFDQAHSTNSFQAYIYPVVHLLIITLLSNPKFSLPLFLSWYVHMYQRMTSRHGSKNLGILVDSCIIDATALMCTHQLVVHLWLKLQQSLVYQGNDRQSQRETVDRPIAGFNLLEYELGRKVSNLKNYYLRQTLLSDRNDGQPKRHRWSKTIPRFNLLAYGLRKPRKVPAFIRCLLNIWPVSSTEHSYGDEVGEFVLKELISYYCTPWIVRNEISAKGQYSLYKLKGFRDLVDLRAPFEDILLRWHIATGILYHTDNTSSSSGSSSISISSRDRSMILSDYMGYLLMVQPWIMSKQRGDTFRKSQDALLQIIELVHSSDVQGDHQSLTEEMQLKKLCTQMQSISNGRMSLYWKKQTENHIENVVHLLSQMQLSMDKISQFLSFQYSGEEGQPPLLPPPPPREKGHNRYFLWETKKEGTHIRAVVQSLLTIQLSLSKMSHILSLQISKNVQQPRLPKEKDEEEQTARKKPPPQLPKEKDQTEYLDGKELLKDINRKIAESLSEMQLSLNKFLQILSLQDSREEQQPAISKKKDEEDQTKTLALDQKQQPTTPRGGDEKDPIKFLDWRGLSKEMKGAIKATRKMSVEMQKSSQHREKDAKGLVPYFVVHQEQQAISPAAITVDHICTVEGSLMKMVESFQALMSIQSLQDTIEEQTSLWPNKKDQTRSLVDDACDLATKIKFTIPNTHLMWETIAEVWVGMLAYACIHSEYMDHIRSLSQGGELASIVWLCMLHLEFVEEFDNGEILEMVIASKAAHSDPQRRYFGWLLNEHEV